MKNKSGRVIVPGHAALYKKTLALPGEQLYCLVERKIDDKSTLDVDISTVIFGRLATLLAYSRPIALSGCSSGEAEPVTIQGKISALEGVEPRHHRVCRCVTVRVDENGGMAG